LQDTQRDLGKLAIESPHEGHQQIVDNRYDSEKLFDILLRIHRPDSSAVIGYARIARVSKTVLEIPPWL
jgi:hypothetical protein